MKQKTHGAEHDEHHVEAASQPIARDPDLPTISNTTLGFFAAGSLAVFVVALLTLIG